MIFMAIVQADVSKSSWLGKLVEAAAQINQAAEGKGNHLTLARLVLLF